jgi:GNAT superfamily N-acetyltransferase
VKSTAPAVAPASSNAAASRSIPGAISVLRWRDEQSVATLLARAFVDDPLVMAICGAPAPERQQRMWWSFRMALRSHCLAGQPAWLAMDASATPLGVALVTRAPAGAPASAQDTPPSDALFVLRGLLHVGLRMALRGAKAARMIAAQAPPGPFTYLRTLGVDPDWHGRGLGSRLVEHVVRTAPTTQPVYLETAKEQNLAFYARQGFACIGEFSCLGVPVWRLIRAAQEPA